MFLGSVFGDGVGNDVGDGVGDFVDVVGDGVRYRLLVRDWRGGVLRTPGLSGGNESVALAFRLCQEAKRLSCAVFRGVASGRAKERWSESELRNGDALVGVFGCVSLIGRDRRRRFVSVLTVRLSASEETVLLRLSLGMKRVLLVRDSQQQYYL